MLLVERLTGLADLLDHAVGLVLFDEPLDPGIVVAGDDQEAVATLEDPWYRRCAATTVSKQDTRSHSQ